MGKFVPLASTADSREEILKLFEKGSETCQVAPSKTKNSTSGPQSDSVYPADSSIFAASWATRLGSLAYLPRPKPTITSQISLAVLYVPSQGIVPKVDGSGSKTI